MDKHWKALWIWGEGEPSPRNEWRCFRKTFAYEGDPGRPVSLSITADSRYVLFVNGYLAGRGTTRSWPKEQMYDTYSIGHLLRPGADNTIAVLVLHFGLANFYYLAGRGGLIAQVEYGDKVIAATDRTWRTSKLAAQDSTSPRMSCQQGFAEVYDARLWDEAWNRPGYDDASWSAALEIGPAGTQPWTRLIPRDIPFLTEEKKYPSKVMSLARVKAPRFTAAIDLRNQMVKDSITHANPVGFTGLLAAVLVMEEDGEVAIGFPTGTRADDLYVDGIRCTPAHVEQPETYYTLTLGSGSHLLLMDITSGDHGSVFHIGVDSEAAFTLRAPLHAALNEEGNPFTAVGPFDAVEYIDYKDGRELRRDDPDYLRLKTIRTEQELQGYERWMQPVSRQLYSAVDVFGASVWRTLSEKHRVPQELQFAVLPTQNFAQLEPFPDGDCEIVIDLGKERSGFIGLELDAPEGTVIDAYGVEYIKDDYRQHTYGLENTFRYICRSGRQSYLSPVRRGFRYLILTIREQRGPVKLHEVYIRQSTYPAAEIGAFRCSDARLNDIWDISRHTTRLCMEDTFIDCPSYEQVFWVGDSRNEALVNYYVFGVTDIVKRCLRLVPGSADMTPLYVNQVPSAWNSVIPNWTFFWAIACREFISHTNDTAFAAEIWPAIQLTMEAYLEHLNGDGLLEMKGWNFLDWAPIDQPREGIVTHQNLFLAKALRDAAAIAAAAGQEGTAAAYEEASRRLTEAINQHLWSDERHAYLDCIHADGRRSDTFSMQTQVVAYLCGAATGGRKALMEAYLKFPPADFVQIGSPFMSFFYYEALEEAGQFELLLADIRAHYGQMIDNDATTCWEMYPNFSENRANPNQLTRSHCHAWSAAPGYFLGECILGVKRLEDGWSKVAVAPQPCGLGWASGIVPLPAGGEIRVRWNVSDNRMTLRVESPADVEIEVLFPEGMQGEVELV
ncbi:family 78 glycoside hydrolase catalytic domain [Paenibacillus sp. S28]|uniref:family 78 glycoside hydrolase catalytic domain n=1 Tax=Paenibacillus sp. S28 TaxID=2767463 RepID=UPI00190CC8C1|nr:family 78 glycoside hydrolase catalytic domain [Paenibacillus sp. S28]MBJ9991347.1 family 78 glycoside hydrolase catalytic domain [Paenibacillus sp. S28]